MLGLERERLREIHIENKEKERERRTERERETEGERERETEKEYSQTQGRRLPISKSNKCIFGPRVIQRRRSAGDVRTYIRNFNVFNRNICHCAPGEPIERKL